MEPGVPDVRAVDDAAAPPGSCPVDRQTHGALPSECSLRLCRESAPEVRRRPDPRDVLRAVFVCSGLMDPLEHSILDQWFQWIVQNERVALDLVGA